MSGPAKRWEYVVIHHTGAEEKSAAQVRAYHKSLGWRDVGYHFLIERDGRVVPGRDLSLPGAHCRAGGMNLRGIGVALIGNLNKRDPFPAQLASLRRLVEGLCRRFRIPRSRVLGHREVPGAATSCPGARFSPARFRESLAAQAKAAAGPGCMENTSQGSVDSRQRI